MKDLASATGEPKSTILHYMAQGLLPAPLSAGRNTAYYDPACVDRVRLIRHLQSHKRMTLVEIREYLARIQDPEELEALAALGDAVFGQGTSGPRLTRAQLLEQSGLSEVTLSRLLSASLIIPQGGDGFDQEDLAMAAGFAQSLASGYDVDDFAYYARLAEELVDKDFALRDRLTRSLSPHEDAVLTAEMARSARLARTYVFERVFRRRVAAMKSLKE